LLFAFEYLIQISAIFSAIVKYSFGALDSFMEGRWESKGVYVFYLELLTDLVHLCVYLIFFGIVLMQYGIPIHLVSAPSNSSINPRFALDQRFVLNDKELQKQGARLFEVPESHLEDGFVS